MVTRRRLLVVFPMAERTTTGVSSGKLSMRSATSRIRSADATDDPPNFMATVNPVAEDATAATDAASSLLRTTAAAPLWHRATNPLLLEHLPPGLAAAAHARYCCSPLPTLGGAAAAGESRATAAANRSATAMSAPSPTEASRIKAEVAARRGERGGVGGWSLEWGGGLYRGRGNGRRGEAGRWVYAAGGRRGSNSDGDRGAVGPTTRRRHHRDAEKWASERWGTPRREWGGRMGGPHLEATCVVGSSPRAGFVLESTGCLCMSMGTLLAIPTSHSNIATMNMIG